jgi:hypothetical protein
LDEAEEGLVAVSVSIGRLRAWCLFSRRSFQASAGRMFDGRRGDPGWRMDCTARQGRATHLDGFAVALGVARVGRGVT